MARRTVDQLLEQARQRIAPRPDPAEAANAVGRGALLVDLRSADERRRTGVIPGSLHIPRSVLEWRADPDCGWTNPHLGDLDRELILVCADGCSSSLAALTLCELGYTRSTDLDGGFTAWTAAGLPVRPAPANAPEQPGMGALEPSDDPEPGRADHHDQRLVAHETSGIGLADVQAEYAGREGKLAELIMGEQIHVGGMISSTELADRAGVGNGMVGVDMCCCTGAGMRFLVRHRNVERMTGVDATEEVVERGRRLCLDEGLADRIHFVLADACASGLASESADFVWGEDAWCYVVDKPTLISEAARIVRPGGVIAFTDWLEGPNPMSPTEAHRVLRFMNFPSILNLGGYRRLLEQAGCRVETAEDTGRFSDYIDLYRNMLTMQLAYDALKIVGFDATRMRHMEEERDAIQELAHAGKIMQGIFVATKL